MAKFREKIKAQELRQQGKSIKEIAKFLGVSKSSISIWCRDIVLTAEQIESLQKRMSTKGSYEARLKGARTQHERRLQQIKRLQEEGFKIIESLSKRDLLLIGVVFIGEKE